MTGVTSLVESSAVGALLAGLVALYEGRMTLEGVEDSTRNTLAISCMFLWIILAALCFSSVYDGLGAVRAIENLLLERWDLSPWTILIVMLLRSSSWARSSTTPPCWSSWRRSISRSSASSASI